MPFHPTAHKSENNVHIPDKIDEELGPLLSNGYAFMFSPVNESETLERRGTSCFSKNRVKTVKGERS